MAGDFPDAMPPAPAPLPARPPPGSPPAPPSAAGGGAAGDDLDPRRSTAACETWIASPISPSAAGPANGLKSDARDALHIARALLPLALIAIIPVAALALRMALSRAREHAADAGAARLTGDPLSLARALGRMVRLEWQRLGVWRWLLPRGPLPPTDAGQSQLARLFLSHPPTAEHMARLAALAPRRGPVRVRCGVYPIAR